MSNSVLKADWKTFAATYDDCRYETNPAIMERFSYHRRLIDVSGEALRAMRTWHKWQESGEDMHFAALERQLEAVDRVCYRIYNDPDVSGNRKRALRIAEWELFDFCIGDNYFRNTDQTVMRWFDQWRLDFNSELLVKKISVG